MKKLALLILIWTIGFAGIANAAKIQTAYYCECSSSKKVCEALENLKILMTKDGNTQLMEGDVGDYEWEFNAGFEAENVSRRLPERLDQEFTAYQITSSKEYLPGAYEAVDILVKRNMVPSSLKLAPKVGEALLINSRNRITMKFVCDKVRPSNF